MASSMNTSMFRHLIFIFFRVKCFSKILSIPVPNNDKTRKYPKINKMERKMKHSVPTFDITVLSAHIFDTTSSCSRDYMHKILSFLPLPRKYNILTKLFTCLIKMNIPLIFCLYAEVFMVALCSSSSPRLSRLSVDVYCSGVIVYSWTTNRLRVCNGDPVFPGLLSALIPLTVSLFAHGQ